MFGEVANRESLKLIWRRQKSDTSHLGSGVEFFYVPEPTKRQSSVFFQVPKPRRKLKRGIFPSLKAQIEGESSEFLQVPELRVKLGIFPSPRAYMKGKRSEFFQVTETV